MALNANSKIKFDSTWWKKQCPKDLFREKKFTRFIDAMDDFGDAERRLDIQAGDDQLSSTDLAELRKAKELIVKIEKPRKEFMDYCAERAKDLLKAKDKKLVEERKTYEVLARILKSTVPAAVQDFNEMLDSFDGDAVDAPMVTPAAHSAYLKRTMPRLKRLPFHFGFALVAQEPTDQRFLFHNKKAPRSLANTLKNDVTPRKLTWGIAYGGGIYEGASYPAATLVLVVQGPMVPSFARRVRVTLKAFGISMFNNVVVIKDGEEVEASTAEEGDELPTEEIEAEDLDALDLEVEEEDPNTVKSSFSKEEYEAMQQADIPPPPPPPPPKAPPPPKPAAVKPAPEGAQALSPELLAWQKKRIALAGKVERCVADTWGPYKKVQGMWKAAVAGAKKGQFDSALKAAAAIERMLEKYTPGPEPDRQKWERSAPPIISQVVEMRRNGEGDHESMLCYWSTAKMLADDGDYALALKFLSQVSWLIEHKDDPQVDEIPVDPVAKRNEAEDLIAKLERIEDELEGALAKLKEADTKTGKKTERPVDRLTSTVRKALYDADPAEVENYDFKSALLALKELDKIIEEARKAGFKAEKTIDHIRKTAADLDNQVKSIAHKVSDPDLEPFFVDASRARGRMAKFLRKNDLFGALPKLKPWQKAVDALMQEAG
ncbi:hypothetical protein LNKW23_39070 [Paralimibaculum aggregatum]|uniref:Uncharacterized protein n=1 Tax=Paralimibaculum aggregatum TaxID=3036245 RepID=A0ABQ6LNC3_9RHOB|nr:hypothetical protein [Limibaculum sp. NKW23]GMG84691.1 hypothetical protein LNKW23_39070 [Limibaculum sp. NKW23]